MGNVDPLDEYNGFFVEMKSFLAVYAKEHANKKIADTVNRLKLVRLADYVRRDYLGTDLLNTDTFLDHDRIDFDALRNDITTNKELLEKLVLYIRNPAFQEVM